MSAAAHFEILWNLEDDPDGNVQHIATHGISMDEVEDVLFDPASETDLSESSARPVTFGRTTAGRQLAVVWEVATEKPRRIRPVTAYETQPRAGRKRRKKR